MIIKVLRENGIQSYEIEINKDKTIMQALEYITLNQDPSLGYYAHSVCNQGICARCLVKANGKSVYMCLEKVGEEDLLLEPINDKVVRDLVVK